MKQILDNKGRFRLLSTLLGMITLLVLSTFQKIAIGTASLALKGFIMPAVIGGVLGFIVGNLLYKNNQLVRRLKMTNKQLEEKVKQRTNELIEKNKKLEALSNTDALTSVANRRHFDSFIRTECKRLSRHKSTMSLILCDIDHFKFYNDTFGHQTGDDCLKQVAELIDSKLRRASDFLARYGGEEFVIVLPDTEIDIAIQIAEQIRKAVKNLNIGNPLSIERCITMSFGVASLSSGDSCATEASELLSKADKAMYIAKETGRNKVCQFSI